MFDGRESPAGATTALGTISTFPANLNSDLTQQAIDATMIHAQAAAPPTSQQLTDIVSFEMGLFTAQVYDRSAGDLHARGALGGARNLVAERGSYYPGINDVLGADPFGIAFDDTSMTLFAAWENGGNPEEYRARQPLIAARRAATSPREKCSSIPRRSPSARCAASMTTPRWAIRCHSKARAPAATIRPTSAIIRCRCRWTSAPATPAPGTRNRSQYPTGDRATRRAGFADILGQAAAPRRSAPASRFRSTRPTWARA